MTISRLFPSFLTRALALLLLGVFTFPTTARAVDFTVGKFRYEVNQDKSSVTLYYALGPEYGEENEQGTLTIPDKVTYEGKTYTVTGIGAGAFVKFSYEAITIPNSVISIGDIAFQKCWYLTSVTIPNSVTSIGSEAFANCTRLTTVNVMRYDATSDEPITKLGDGVFSKCDALETIYVPADALEEYKTDDGWKDYLGKIVQMPSIPYAVLSDNDDGEGTRTLTFKYESHTLGENEWDVSNLTSPPGWSDDAASITKVVFESSFAAFSPTTCKQLFMNCSRLTTITGLENLKTNSVTNFSEMFYGCSSLESLNFGKDFTIAANTVTDRMFSGCTSLKTISVDEENTTLKSVDDILFNKEGSKLILCPVGKGVTIYTIPEGVTTIGHQAFSGCTALTSVTITDDNVQWIEEEAFLSCSNLENVYVLRTAPPTMGNHVFDYLENNQYKPLSCNIYVHGNGYTEDNSWMAYSPIVIAIATPGDEVTATTEAEPVITYNDMKYYTVGTTFALGYTGDGLQEGFDPLFKANDNDGNDVSDDVISNSTLTLPGYDVTVGVEINKKPVKPTISLPSGSYHEAQIAMVSSTVAGATIKYYLGNTAPETPETFTTPIPITKSTKLTAWAELDGVKSDTASTTYIIYEPYDSPYQQADQIWGTYYGIWEDMTLPNNLEAYFITEIGEAALVITKLDYLPKEVPVLIKKTGDLSGAEYSVYTGSPSTVNFGDNILKYATNPINTTGMQYVLFNNEFVKATGTIPAEKCYIELNDYAANAHSRAFSIGNDNGTTSIQDVPSSIFHLQSEECYDLQGRKIQKPTKAGLYIVKGKLVMYNNK